MFYPSTKECNTESRPITENDDTSTLTDSLIDLKESIKFDISDATVITF